MKKLLTGVCLALSMTFLASCGTELTDDNAISTYTSAKETITSAKSTKTTTIVDVGTEAEGQSETTNYTSEYSEVKVADDKFEAYAHLFSDAQETPMELNLYFKDDALYGTRSNDDSKLKYSATYDEFKDAYDTKYLLDITDESVVTKIITKNEENNNVLSLTLNKDNYADVFDAEIQNVVAMTMIPVEMLAPEFSDITYIVTFDGKDNIKTVNMVYDITMTIDLSSITGGDNATETPNQVIKRHVSTTTTVDQILGVKIEYPADLDTYVEQ